MIPVNEMAVKKCWGQMPWLDLVSHLKTGTKAGRRGWMMR